MNKTFHYLIAGSMAALLCAGGGGLWLVWQSIAQNHSLEQKNRELQASLEASRIRIENFCEYPVEALCRIDEKTGSVVSAMSGFSLSPASTAAEVQPATASLAEEKPGSAVATSEKTATAVTPVAPSNTLPTNTASAVAKPVSEPVSQPVAPAISRTEATLVASTPEQKNTTPEAVPALAAAKKIEPAIAPATPVALSAASAPKKPEVQTDAPTPVAEVPAGNVQKSLAAASEVQRTEIPAVEPSHNTKELPASIDETITAPSLQEVTGAIVFLPKEEVSTDASTSTTVNLKDNAVKASAGNKTSAVPASGKDSKKKAQSLSADQATLKKTWSRVEKDGDIFVFSISGSGPSLPAEGRLLSAPWRYELKLQGRWDVKKHKIPANRLVRSIQQSFRNGDTVLTFRLSGKPYRCSLHRQDARSFSLRIR
ncbi:MAG: hypothetical protein IKJ34_04370 [Mailhella sp.]|nr:hypothetical protein [Mailhella sp.]